MNNAFWKAQYAASDQGVVEPNCQEKAHRSAKQKTNDFMVVDPLDHRAHDASCLLARLESTLAFTGANWPPQSSWACSQALRRTVESAFEGTVKDVRAAEVILLSQSLPDRRAAARLAKGATRHQGLLAVG